MEDNSTRIIECKAVITGDISCGKTCLLHTFHRGSFPDNGQYVPAVFETWVADLSVNNQPVKLALWDTASQEEFNRLRLLCYSNTSVVILCFSIGDPNSLDNVKYRWKRESAARTAGAPAILVGLKLDLRNDQYTVERLARHSQHPVTQAEGQRMAEKIGAEAYIECSAMQNHSVRQVFELAARAAVMPREKRKGSVVNTDCCVIL